MAGTKTGNTGDVFEKPKLEPKQHLSLKTAQACRGTFSPKELLEPNTRTAERFYAHIATQPNRTVVLTERGTEFRSRGPDDLCTWTVQMDAEDSGCKLLLTLRSPCDVSIVLAEGLTLRYHFAPSSGRNLQNHFWSILMKVSLLLFGNICHFSQS